MKKKIVSIVLVGMMAVASLAGCGGASSDNSSDAAATVSAAEEEAPAGEAVDASSIMVGEIESYVVEDGGWCQATHEGIVAAMNEMGIPEENLIVIENIDDTDQASVTAAAESLIEEGCNLIIGASTGYASYLPEVAAEYPEVTIAQYGAQTEGLVGYAIRSYEGMFLAGYACELLSQDENTQLGYSASYNEFSVRTAINAFALGAKAANPEATVKVAEANSWYDIDVETQCAQSLIDSGIKYMGMEASSPAIPETCAKNGAYVVGYHNDMSYIAEDAVICSFTWNFAPIFKGIMEAMAAGTSSSSDYYYMGGECASLTAFADFVPEEVQTAVAEMKEKIDNGEVQVYAGPISDNKGNVLVEEGAVMDDADILAQEFFVENVITTWE